MGPIWGRQDPGGPRVGAMNLAIWVVTWGTGSYHFDSSNAIIDINDDHEWCLSSINSKWIDLNVKSSVDYTVKMGYKGFPNTWYFPTGMKLNKNKFHI